MCEFNPRQGTRERGHRKSASKSTKNVTLTVVKSTKNTTLTVVESTKNVTLTGGANNALNMGKH